MTNFESAKTVGELRAILNNLPDDTVLFQTNHGGCGGYRNKVQILSLEKNDKNFGSFHKSIKIFQCSEDKIKGTYNDLTQIVIFGS